MKKQLKLIVLCAPLALLVAGCTAELSSVCTDSESAKDGLSTEPPPPIPGSANMSTVIGPLAPNMLKWGPDQALPFSWPGRAVQRDVMSPIVSDEQLIYEVRLSEGAKLHKVHVWVDPANGHADVPANRAQAMVWTHNGGFVESETIASVATMDDTVPNYEQRYLLTMTFDEPYVVKADTRVFVYVFGEWGSNALPGLAVDTPEILFSPPN